MKYIKKIELINLRKITCLQFYCNFDLLHNKYIIRIFVQDVFKINSKMRLF